MTEPLLITDFAALHFVQREDGTLIVPSGSIVSFTPIGQFIEMKISVKGRTVASAVLHKSALKISRESQMRRNNDAQ